MGRRRSQSPNGGDQRNQLPRRRCQVAMVSLAGQVGRAEVDLVTLVTIDAGLGTSSGSREAARVREWGSGKGKGPSTGP